MEWLEHMFILNKKKKIVYQWSTRTQKTNIQSIRETIALFSAVYIDGYTTETEKVKEKKVLKITLFMFPAVISLLIYSCFLWSLLFNLTVDEK